MAAARLIRTPYLSAVTVLELKIGVQMMARKADAQGSLVRGWLNQARAQFNGRILAFAATTVDARHCMCQILEVFATP